MTHLRDFSDSFMTEFCEVPKLRLRGDFAIYILWSCIDRWILDSLQGDDLAAVGRLPGYTLLARVEAT